MSGWWEVLGFGRVWGTEGVGLKPKATPALRSAKSCRSSVAAAIRPLDSIGALVPAMGDTGWSGGGGGGASAAPGLGGTLGTWTWSVA